MSQELFDEAVRLEEDGQNERALAVWRQIVETTPTRNAYLRLAGCAKELGLVDDVERAFQRALEIDGRSEIALRSLGILAVDRCDYLAAVDYLRRACEIEETAGALTVLGVALRHTLNDLDAEVAYRRAIQIDRKYEEAYYNLGVLLRLNDRPSEAQPLLRKALELDPDYAAAHRELGYVLSLRAPDAEAETHLRKAIELDPKDSWAHIYFGTHLWRCTEVDGAMKEFRIAKELEPEWAVPLWSLGNIYESESIDLDLAQSFFEHALRLEPDDWCALKGLARVFKKRGQIDLAREYVTRALQQYPRDERSLALLSDLDVEGTA